IEELVAREPARILLLEATALAPEQVGAEEAERGLERAAMDATRVRVRRVLARAGGPLRDRALERLDREQAVPFRIFRERRQRDREHAPRKRGAAVGRRIVRRGLAVGPELPAREAEVP